MKLRFLFLCSVLILIACGGDETDEQWVNVQPEIIVDTEEELLEKIKLAQQEILSLTTDSTNSSLPGELIDNVNLFRNRFPQSQNLLNVLETGKAVAHGKSDFRQTLEYVDEIIGLKENHSGMDELLGLKALCLTELGKKSEADSVHAKLKREFPDSPWSKNGEGDWANLSEDELLEAISKSSN